MIPSNISKIFKANYALTLKALNYFVKTSQPNGFFLFEIITSVLASSFWFIWIPMLEVYDQSKYFYSYSAGIDFRRQNLTLKTKVDPAL